jgi:nucleotide-binding universal stress UspA family protein
MNSDRTHTSPQAVPSHSRSPRVKVVGYDGSDRGRHVVEGAARRVGPGGRLIIVHVLEPTPGEMSSQHDEIYQRMVAELGPAVLDGIQHEFRIVEGPVARALIDTALQVNALAIVIGTRRAPSRLGQRTIRSQLEDGPVPVVALVGRAERESHPMAQPIDDTHRYGYDSFPASDPPSSWSGPANGAPLIREPPVPQP